MKKYRYDWQRIKENVSVEDVVQFLGLKTKSDSNGIRAQCPRSDNPRSLALNYRESAFYCHQCKTGGSVIDLVAHISDISPYEAARDLHNRFLEDGSADAEPAEAVPQKKPEKGKKTAAKSADFKPLSSTFDLQKAIDDLIHEHPKVQALGLSVEDADRLDIGFKPRGLYKGRVCEPSRTTDGHPVCLKPLPEDFQFPKTLHWPASNVVPLKKHRA